MARRLGEYGSSLVTSDSDLILKKCSKYKDVLLLKRPKYLSNDKASLMDVIKHVIKKIGFKENVILLQPTSPLRTDNDVIKSIKMLQRGVDAVMSQCKLQYNSAKINANKSNQNFAPLGKETNDIFVPNGAVFAANYNWIMAHNSFYDVSVKTFEMPLERSIDIDYQYQFTMAESLIRNKVRI